MYVKTGDVSKAGTDANVHLKIFGEKGDTGLLKLENAESTSNKFERNRTDHFILHAEDIGKVCYICTQNTMLFCCTCIKLLSQICYDFHLHYSVITMPFMNR